MLSVANLARKDGIDFLRAAPQIGIKVTTQQCSSTRFVKPTTHSRICVADGTKERRSSLRNFDRIAGLANHVDPFGIYRRLSFPSGMF